MRRTSERRLVLMVGLLTAVPVLVSAARAVAAGWTPVFDDAIVTVRAFDVLSSHAPLVGQYSDASLPGVPPVYNAGPLLFWLLAVPTRLPGDWALPLTTTLVNTASIVGVVWLAHRRGGRLLMFGSAVALIAMCQSMPDTTLYTVVNPWCAILPLVLLLFVAWSVACGEYELLPLTVLLASFVTQVHFSLILPTLCALTVALVGLVTFLMRGRTTTAVLARPGLRRSLLAALAVALVCWSAPLVDQALNRPGNLVRIARTTTAEEHRVGMPGGWRAAVRSIGIPPWWLGRPRATSLSIYEVIARPSPTAVVSCLLAVAALVSVALIGLQRRRRDLTTGAALALLLGAAIVLGASAIPFRLALSIGKGLGWATPAGMFTWLVLGWSLAALLQPRLMAMSRPAWFASAGLGITALAAALVALDDRPSRVQWTYEPVRDITSHVNQRLTPSGTMLAEVSSSSAPFTAFRVKMGIVYQLRRLGHHIVVSSDTDNDEKLGTYYSAARHRPQRRLDVEHSDATAPPPGGRVLGRVPLPDAPPDISPRAFAVSVAPVLACPPATAAAANPDPSRDRLRIVPNHVTGFVDRSQIVGTRAHFCGWAANLTSHRAADAVLVFADGKIVGAVRPTIRRPDVERGNGPLRGDAGYSISVPLSSVQQKGKKAKVRLYGVERGVATPLPFGCASAPQEFGC